ncbi:hypothetical protein [Novipirellula galeiformis]|uniref:hypothetical protein n=1 Tax=Novipirellula galeiformis TaxID=2528004 RepID=UPI0018CFE8E7|nr:hypothetical protein [Novipirellula galeiformis]
MIIRPFCNADLPRLVNVWIEHWSCLGASPPVAMATMEQAILARTFFDPANLLIAQSDGDVLAWCHVAVDGAVDSEIDTTVPKSGVPEESVATRSGRILAFCFSPDGGLEVCDSLLAAAEARVKALGADELNVGLVRDCFDGYVGLPPIGHGIGVPEGDTRMTALLARSGYTLGESISRLVASTSPYRPPINREALQFRRTTRGVRETQIPTQPRLGSAMSHFDIERHQVVDHRTAEVLAEVGLWCSDVEAQVMDGAHAILDLTPLAEAGQLKSVESFLIGSLIQTLADRRIYSVETAINSSQTELIGQLESLQFENTEKGNSWKKKLI